MALAAFQDANDLVPSGVLDDDTEAALSAAAEG